MYLLIDLLKSELRSTTSDDRSRCFCTYAWKLQVFPAGVSPVSFPLLSDMKNNRIPYQLTDQTLVIVYEYSPKYNTKLMKLQNQSPPYKERI